MTSSNLTKEERLLEGLNVKKPKVGGKANNEHWAQLVNVASSCTPLTERLGPLQNAVYNEAANTFDHSQRPKSNLAKHSRRTKLAIQLIKEKNLLMTKINTIFLPDQWIALEQLLTNVENKICSLRKSEKVGLPYKSPFLKSFPTNFFSFEDFF